MTTDDPGLPSDPAAEGDYVRPPGVDDSFAPREPEALYTPPPPTVSPEERAEFGRPVGNDAEFAPLPGERIDPAHRVVVPPVPPGLTREYGRPDGAEEFDPEPGTRIVPGGREPESPWWKADARRDPWRDPRSPFWLGRPAVFAGGRPSQVLPDEDAEQDDEVVPPEEEAAPEPVKAVRGGRFGLSVLPLALIVALVAGALGGGAGYWFATRAHSALHNSDLKLAKTGTPANRPPGSIADIVQRVSPAVVSIQEHTDEVDGFGAGVVIDKGGYVLTNNHVIEDAATAQPAGDIFVTFADKSRVTAKIVGRDDKTDVAVLKIDKSKLTIAALGDSDKIAVGDPVIAIGSPLGLQSTVTSGIVSGLDRAFGTQEGAVLDAIQTDASINPGNSGGPLIDSSGAVIGINTALQTPAPATVGQSGSVGLGFAIPINQARTIAEALIHTGTVVHASLGLQTRDTRTTDGEHDGAYVSQVVPEGPADQAGLKAGDVITLVDSTLIESSDRLKVVALEHKPGDMVKVRYYRGNKKVDVTVSLGTD
ncbi:MAG TPA: trypsin-like peptidase domain-containing protein [Jatrophihabitantaceae bacterium]|jgi:S1-C subfamily serine protease